MTILMVGSYHRPNTNDYIKYVSNAYYDKGVTLIFEEQNFLFSNFLPNAIHIQWPESIYKWKNLIPQTIQGYEKLKSRLQWYKENNIVIMQTAHNILPHDSVTDFDQQVYNLFFDFVDIVIHHGKSSIEIIKEKYPQTLGAQHIIAPHGPYPKKKLPSTEVGRHKFSLPKNKLIFTNFGKQRSYKGRDFCFNVFNNLNQKICFFSAGALFPNCKPYETNDENLKQYYKDIPDQDIPHLMAATDVFFLGHTSGLNSGILSLALTYNKPVIFPDIGNFKDQIKGWELYETYTPENIESAINAVNKMYLKLTNPKKITFSNYKWIENNTWDIHVSNIIKSYNKLQEQK